MMERQNGYLTVYMALCLTVILSLCLTLIDGARRNGAAMEAACVADVGLQSVMAEYHRQLLEQYNLFAIDSSYGASRYGSYNVEAHLLRYLEKNLSVEDVFLSSVLYRDFLGLQVDGVEMTGVSILTDDGGTVFRQLAAKAMEDDMGLSALGELQEWMEIIEINGLETAETEQQKADADRQIQEYEYEDEEGELQRGVENPTSVIEENKRQGILRLVLKDDAAVSRNTLDTSELIYSRLEQGRVSCGNMPISDSSWTEALAERFFFQEYLLKYMGSYGHENEQDALKYQIEYLIAGHENDTDNLRSVANRLCALREAANAMYLWTDEKKMAEIKTMAIVACSLLLSPELIPVMETSIVLGWAYAESLYDVKTLLSGGRVPLLKDSASWHYSLHTALSGNLQDSTEEGEGLSYQDYLRIFMFLTDLDRLTGRAMNMVEADIRLTEGNAAFCLDGCYTKVEFDIRISSTFGYEYQLIRARSYD